MHRATTRMVLLTALASSPVLAQSASPSDAQSREVPSERAERSGIEPTFASSDAILEARVSFQEGIRHSKEGRWLEALQSFERSEARHPHVITSYNIGYCERLLGHAVRARKMFAQALADNAAHEGGELPADLVEAAQAYLADAERQIARVLVMVPKGAFTIDGRPLELTAIDGPHPVLLAGTRSVGGP